MINAMKNKFSNRDTQSVSTLPSAGFTLVELLIVIATIGILAALLMPVFAGVSKHAVIQRAQSERDQLETVIDRYHAKYGYYPPGNANASAQNLYPTLTNQLYYELVGTTNIGTVAQPNFLTLDTRITNTPVLTQQAFGVSAFMNLSRSGAGTEDGVAAQSFLPGLKPAQIADLTVGKGLVTILCTAANSDPSYQPIIQQTASGPKPVLTEGGGNANPWRYLYPGVHNPQSYDLWIQIFIGGKTNLISNWKTDPEVNPNLP